jgi:hypothetical protein
MQRSILALAGLISLLCRKEMNMFRTISALVCTLAFVGCVNQNTWSPAVDPYNDPNASKLSVNEAECRQIAQKASGNSMQETGKGSPDRGRSLEGNLDLFAKMRSGECEEGTYVLRAKIDMASPNINLRDPALYRIDRKSVV